MRLRYNLGGGAQIITVGHDLNDGHWHKVHVQRHEDRTLLTVDNITQMKTSRGKEFNFGRMSTNSDVYVGGMPTWYNTKLALLALPSVIFEPRFVGAVRNLIYPDVEGGTPRRQETRPKDQRVSRPMPPYLFTFYITLYTRLHLTLLRIHPQVTHFFIMRLNFNRALAIYPKMVASKTPMYKLLRSTDGNWFGKSDKVLKT